MTKGIIFNIQKYSIHDGPGIRTTVFLKGCPLSCNWCHNPESQAIGKEIVFYQDRCTNCGNCINHCIDKAIEQKDGKINLNRERCIACGLCLDQCPRNARDLVGRIIKKEEMIKEILKDRIFFEESDGGVTFSGGEPLMQGDFLKEVLLACKEEGIHTTLDTSGFAPINLIKEIVPYVDLFLYDIKFIDDVKHIKYTGVSNKQIIENFKYITSIGKRVFARVPIIPGINNSDEDIRALGEFLKNSGIEQVNLLPYHNISMGKYAKLSRNYSLKEVIEPTDEEMNEVSNLLSKYNLRIKIGG